MINLKHTFLSIFTLVSVIGFSQGLYIDANAGYAFPFNTNSEIIWEDNSTSNYNYDNGNYTFSGTTTNVPLSLGKGGVFGASVGYMFNKYIGAEVQLGYLIGGATTAKSSYVEKETMNGVETMMTTTTSTSLFSNMFSAAPALVLKSGFETVNPYAKLGVVFGFGSIMAEQAANDAGVLESQKFKLNGGVAIGLNTKVGVLFEGKGIISYFAEVCMVNMSYSPTKGIITEFMVDGVDILPNLTTSDKEIEFSDETTYSSAGPIDVNAPSQELKMAFPFSSVGVNVGVRFNLGKK